MKPFYENVFVLSVILKIELDCDLNITLRTHYSFSALDMTMLLSRSFCFKNEHRNGDAASICCAHVEGFFSTDSQKHDKVSLFGLGMYHPSNVHFNSNPESTEI